MLYFFLDLCIVLQYSAPVSEEESQDLASEVLPPGFLVVHDTSGCGQHNLGEYELMKEVEQEQHILQKMSKLFQGAGAKPHLSELPGRQQVVGPLLDVSNLDVEPEDRVEQSQVIP